MVYGDSVPTLSYGVSENGLVNGDKLTGALATKAGSTSNVGSYAITQGTLAASSNYKLTYTGANLAVTARPITVTANKASMVYGDSVPTLSYGVTSGDLVNNDQLTGKLATKAGSTSNVGSYSITQGSLANSNYDITYKGNKLAVNKAALTVTAKDASKTFNGLAYKGGNGVTFNGLVNNESRSVLGGKLTYGGSSQGAVNVGNYTIDASGLTSGNYAITYVPGQLNVTAPPSVQPDASLSIKQPVVAPVKLFSRNGRQLVTYDPVGSSSSNSENGSSNRSAGPNGASSTGANANGQGGG